MHRSNHASVSGFCNQVLRQVHSLAINDSVFSFFLAAIEGAMGIAVCSLSFQAILFLFSVED